MRHNGFTLVEILVSLAIIGVLAAIVFAAETSSRAKSRETVCISNLRQLGIAISMYAEDNDQFYPEGDDPEDKYTTIWGGQYGGIVPRLPLLTTELEPYIKAPSIWECPSDTGFSVVDTGNGALTLPAHPSSYNAYGMSYYYRTEIGLRHETVSGLTSYSPYIPYPELGAAEANILFDGSGSWHATNGPRYNTLMGDGRVETLTGDQLAAAWRLALVPPSN